MRKFISTFALTLILAAVFLCGCASREEKPVTGSSSEINAIAALAPSLNETLIDLGLGNKIIGYDLESSGLEGLNPDAVKFDIAAPDLEQLIALAPDVVFVSGISFYDAENPYQPLEDAGIKVVNFETADSIEEIHFQISEIAAAAGMPEKGEELSDELASSLNKIRDAAEKIPEDERKTVYFEISAAPEMYTSGSGTYLNELIEIIGAKNIFADSDGWMPVNGEAVAAANPDVILTNVDYLDDPVSEILSRDGFSEINAVKNGAVFYIDNRSSSLPNENVAKAALEMAKAVYPEYFDEF